MEITVLLKKIPKNIPNLNYQRIIPYAMRINETSIDTSIRTQMLALMYR